jgi:hypothetical protein
VSISAYQSTEDHSLTLRVRNEVYNKYYKLTFAPPQLGLEDQTRIACIICIGGGFRFRVLTKGEKKRMAEMDVSLIVEQHSARDIPK